MCPGEEDRGRRGEGANIPSVWSLGARPCLRCPETMCSIGNAQGMAGVSGEAGASLTRVSDFCRCWGISQQRGGSSLALLFNLNTLPSRCRKEKTTSGKRWEGFMCPSPRRTRSRPGVLAIPKAAGYAHRSHPGSGETEVE